MDGLKEKALELASQDAEFAEKLSAAETPEAAAALLREKGLDVTAEDLLGSEQPGAAGAAKLSDDELDAVAGGKKCWCTGAGAGIAEGCDETCACVVAGMGMAKFSDGERISRCGCIGEGIGESYN